MKYSDVDMAMAVAPFKMLFCKSCGHRPCPAHDWDESDSLIDNLEKMANPKPSSSDKLYIRSTRRIHDFGQNGKEWWQSYYLPAEYRAKITQSETASDILGGTRGERVREVLFAPLYSF